MPGTAAASRHDRRAGRLSDTLRGAVSAKPFYAEVSLYRQQIALYLAHFPRDRFLFMDFAELATNPVAVARCCIAFAGLDPGRAALELDTPKNASFQFNGLGRAAFALVSE